MDDCRVFIQRIYNGGAPMAQNAQDDVMLFQYLAGSLTEDLE
jgi:hypothetical protein